MSDLVRRQDMPTRIGDDATELTPPSIALNSKRPEIPGYEMLGELGSGAMGEVYQARNLETGMEVAIKVMAPELNERRDLVKRFEREIALLTKLKHPNIAGAIDNGNVDGRLYLAMEFVRGPTLTNLLKVSGPFSEVDALRITLQIAQALEYAWKSSGLIHRDLKPSNLLAVPEENGQGERVKIIDFGLARSVYSEDVSMTMTGMVMGTPNYMSPEQIRGEKELGIQSDMYGLGCTVFHLITGRLPYIANAPAQVMAAHLKEAIPDPGSLVPSLTPATRHLIMTCMAKKVSDRYQSYEPLIKACEAGLRTITLRDTTSIRLLRRPLVLSRPQRVTAAAVAAAEAEPDLYGDRFETNRLRRKEAEESAKRGSDASNVDSYKPSTDRYPTPNPENAPAPRHMRPGSASEALAKAATSKINRVRSTTSVHRNPGTGAVPRKDPSTELPMPIPSTASVRRQVAPMGPAPEEKHTMAWVVVGITVVGFCIAAYFVLFGGMGA